MKCSHFAVQLRAKEEVHRQEASLILKNLAHQCSDPWAIEELLNFLFAILNGWYQQSDAQISLRLVSWSA